ncbi:hypothetical protein [Variovorax sp. PBL-E5]|uniref:hypothetical protein n=1 Tax=Variovorax sp. PBL-E5 TaxID=434014 RepID=UPI001317D56B|nr:hypothetical protein [Variovorax sp. PBL-E5]VTU28414.1 hypothetical protein E5CHR_02604 [Variovorax sp. PBL-E5]
MTGPQKRESPLAGGQFAGETTEEVLIVGHVGADSKTVATLKAKFALAGHEMTVARNRDGRVICTVSRWGQARSFTHFHDVEEFLRQIGGAA